MNYNDPRFRPQIAPGVPRPQGMGLMEQPTLQGPMTQAPPGPPPASPSGGKGGGMLQKLQTGFKNQMDDGLMDRLAMGFNTMRLDPDPAISAMAARRLQERRANKKVTNRANKTADWLEKQGRDDMAGMIRQNPELGAAMLLEYQKAQLEPRDSFQTLSGADLNKMGYEAVDPNALYNFDQKTGKLSSVGGSGTTVNVGDDTPAGIEALDKAYADKYLAWRTGGGVDMAQQAAQVGTALSRIEDAMDNGDTISGPLLGALPRQLRVIVNPQGMDVQEQIEEVVQRNLRTVLGAQFTEKEGERLISRAYNPQLSPRENIGRIRKLFEQISRAAEGQEQMAQYFEKNNTLMGFRGNIPSVDDFYDALGGREPGTERQQPGQGLPGFMRLQIQNTYGDEQARERVLKEKERIWNEMTEEEKQYVIQNRESLFQ